MEILYICDRKACSTCKKSCKHTNDINHAKNFGRNKKSAWESDDKCRSEFNKMRMMLKPIYEQGQKAIKESSEYRKQLNKLISEGKDEKEILEVALELIEVLTSDTTIRSLYNGKKSDADKGKSFKGRKNKIRIEERKEE